MDGSGGESYARSVWHPHLPSLGLTHLETVRAVTVCSQVGALEITLLPIVASIIHLHK